MMDLKQLQRQVSAGKRPHFVFFWGHTPARSGALGRECFSQWYPAPFEVDGRRYPTAEHYMMAEKAALFGDDEHREQILAAGSPSAAKALGRQVRGFRDETWVEARSAIVVRANLAKFSQNAELGTFLAGTKKRVLVEASPKDRIWGIGLAASDPRAENPLQWRGLNLLGFALMDVREQLADR